jgi:hypothetical protein
MKKLPPFLSDPNPSDPALLRACRRAYHNHGSRRAYYAAAIRAAIDALPDPDEGADEGADVMPSIALAVMEGRARLSGNPAFRMMTGADAPVATVPVDYHPTPPSPDMAKGLAYHEALHEVMKSALVLVLETMGDEYEVRDSAGQDGADLRVIVEDAVRMAEECLAGNPDPEPRDDAPLPLASGYGIPEEKLEDMKNNVQIIGHDLEWDIRADEEFPATIAATIRKLEAVLRDYHAAAAGTPYPKGWGPTIES